MIVESKTLDKITLMMLQLGVNVSDAPVRQTGKINKCVIIQKYRSFKKCKTEIDKTRVEDAQNLVQCKCIINQKR